MQSACKWILLSSKVVSIHMKPFEYDITDAVRFGEENLVVVEVRNAWLDELGTGGLMGPSMIWQAAE